MHYNPHMVNLQITATGLMASAVSGALGYFQVIVLDNINMYLAIIGVVFMDTFFGISNAIINKTYSNKKAMKCVYYILSYSVIVTVVIMIEKAHPAAYYLSEATILPIIVFQLISALTNASLAGAIPKGLLLKILEKINAKDLITTNVSNGSDDENSDVKPKDEIINTD